MNSETWLLSMCCGAAAIPLCITAWSWLIGNRNGADCEPEPEDNVIRSDVPGHPEYATQRAAEIANQRMTGRNLGGKLHVYTNADGDHADQHSQQRYTGWMLENDRAAKVGVIVHKTDWQTRDRMGEQRGRVSNTWVNGEPFVDAETKSGGGMNVLVAIAALVVLGMVGFSLYCAYMLWWPK